MSAWKQASLGNARAWRQLEPLHCDSCDEYLAVASELTGWAERLAWSLREVLRWQVLDKTLQDWVEWNYAVWGFAIRLEMLEPGTMITNLYSKLNASDVERIAAEIHQLIANDVIAVRYNSITDEFEYSWRRDDDHSA